MPKGVQSRLQAQPLCGFLFPSVLFRNDRLWAHHQLASCLHLHQGGQRAGLRVEAGWRDSDQTSTRRVDARPRIAAVLRIHPARRCRITAWARYDVFRSFGEQQDDFFVIHNAVIFQASHRGAQYICGSFCDFPMRTSVFISRSPVQSDLC